MILTPTNIWVSSFLLSSITAGFYWICKYRLYFHNNIFMFWNNDFKLCHTFLGCPISQRNATAPHSTLDGWFSGCWLILSVYFCLFLWKIARCSVILVFSFYLEKGESWTISNDHETFSIHSKSSTKRLDQPSSWSSL